MTILRRPANRGLNADRCDGRRVKTERLVIRNPDHVTIAVANPEAAIGFFDLSASGSSMSS
jgi:hypothetical protein